MKTLTHAKSITITASSGIAVMTDEVDGNVTISLRLEAPVAPPPEVKEPAKTEAKVAPPKRTPVLTAAARVVLDDLRRYGPTTSRKLAKLTFRKRTTVAARLSDLTSLGLATVISKVQSKNGPATFLYAATQEAQPKLAIPKRGRPAGRRTNVYRKGISTKVLECLPASAMDIATVLSVPRHAVASALNRAASKGIVTKTPSHVWVATKESK